jgi:hypothetical protein
LVKTPRTLLTFRLFGTLFVVLWGALAWYQASLGNTGVAVLVALPVIATVLALIAPRRGPGSFAFTHEIAPVPDETLPKRQQELRMGFAWLLGSCLVPLGALLVFVADALGFQEGAGIYVFVGGLIPLLGIACFLKAIGAFFRAWRADP